MADPLERIAYELECIRDLLERFMVVTEPPTVLDEPLGSDAITYLDEEELMEFEEEELRQKNRGLIPTPQDA